MGEGTPSGVSVAPLCDTRQRSPRQRAGRNLLPRAAKLPHAVLRPMRIPLYARHMRLCVAYAPFAYAGLNWCAMRL